MASSTWAYQTRSKARLRASPISVDPKKAVAVWQRRPVAAMHSSRARCRAQAGLPPAHAAACAYSLSVSAMAAQPRSQASTSLQSALPDCSQ
ncbi:MAG: hypothetical protein U1E53_04550 [Dongiaceae bacterium]